MNAGAGSSSAQSPAQSQLLIIGAASLGTMFEWYDFFLYGALAVNIAAHFFSAADETSAFIFALAAFASGFVVRPFGALVFGRIGDMVGRKYTFIVTLTIIGLATFLVGLLPTYNQFGIAAPILLVVLRMLQGLAIGGEYCGAAIYVAEHAPAGKRRLHTGWISATTTMGMLLSLTVIMVARASVGPEAFAAWGWRIPFLVSIFLLGISLWIRMRLNESPIFQRMKAEAATSKAPLAEAFGHWSNVKIVLVALAGIAGSAAIWYMAHFYTRFFLERVLKVEGFTTNKLMALGLLIAAPLYVFFGWVSDKVGRKTVILGGCVVAIITVFPLYHLLTAAANPALARAQAMSPVVVRADPAACSFQFDPLNRTAFDRQSCDIAKSFLTRAGVSYRNEPLMAGAAAEIAVGELVLKAPDPRTLADGQRKSAIAAHQKATRAALTADGYPASATRAEINTWVAVMLIVCLSILGAMSYAPVAALLVELFPARIRYTSLSLPNHIVAGWLGGFLPTTAFAIVAATGNMYAGLWFPVVAAIVSAVVGVFLLPETFKQPIEG